MSKMRLKIKTFLVRNITIRLAVAMLGLLNPAHRNAQDFLTTVKFKVKCSTNVCATYQAIRAEHVVHYWHEISLWCAGEFLRFEWRLLQKVCT